MSFRSWLTLADAVLVPRALVLAEGLRSSMLGVRVRPDELTLAAARIRCDDGLGEGGTNSRREEDLASEPFR